MVPKRFDNVKTKIQAKTGRSWDQIQDMRSSVKRLIINPASFWSVIFTKIVYKQ